jgi:prophage antirepressor-like protein
MENKIQVFQNQEFGKLRTVEREGEPWFVAADVCNALELTNSRMAVDRLDADEKGVSSTDTLGGKQNMAIVSESGLYSLVLGSRKPQAHAFKRWVTHDVIPSIRRHGLYATPETAEKILGDPDFLIQALTELKQEREKRIAAEAESVQQKQIISELQPKASYYDKVLASPDPIPTSLIAKDYGKSATWLNRTLNALGVQYKLNGTWILYQKYAEQGYTKSSTYPYVDKLGMTHTSMFTYWTQKGRLFIYGLLKEHGILPLMEQEDQKSA